MPELGPLGSVRGALRNERPYRECEKSLGIALTRALTSIFEAYDRSKFNSAQKSAF